MESVIQLYLRLIRPLE